MHKRRDYENPGLPIGNPYSYHITTTLSLNIVHERGNPGVGSAPLVDSSFDHEDWLNFNEHTPGRTDDQSVPPAPSEHQQSSDVLITPPHHPPSPFEPAPPCPYNWLYVDPDLDF